MTAWTWLFAVISFVFPIMAQEPARVQWRTNANPSDSWVELTGLPQGALDTLRKWDPAQWQKVLAVQADPGDGPLALIELPAMIGIYRVEGTMVSFKPQFPLQAGIEYVALFRPGELPGASDRTDYLAAKFKIRRSPTESSTVVESIYPTASELPENLLKLYVHFSAPMSGGAIYNFIRLEDDKGEAVELPFLEIDEELWNPDMTRLTLFIDPGRIKRGVKPLEDIGPALQAGHQYTLKIDRLWKDAQGVPMKAPFEKHFKVTGPDRDSPDPKSWKLKLPQSGSTEPLTIEFGEPLDHALALRLLTISLNGRILDGRSRLVNGERSWVFTPERPWARGGYSVVFENTLEDLAGNRVGKPFEVDLFEGVQRRLTRTNVSIPFDVN